MTTTPLSAGGPRVSVVADLGGTTLRLGRVAGGVLDAASVRRIPTEGIGRHRTLPAQVLQDQVVEQLAGELEAYLRSPYGAGADSVGVSFAGPLSKDGTVLAGPTLWGGTAAPLPVTDILARRLPVPVVVANDITAAAWRYAATETVPFCLITVSSGIGHKVFRHGEVLIDEAGHGGEIGHWRVDPRPDALPCECGGRGHLGGIASGRGVLLAARGAAADDPAGFAGSALAGPAGHRPDGITNQSLAQAVRAGDPFATTVLSDCLLPLAQAVDCLFTAIGIRRYLFIGGFAVAVGTPFLRLLGDQLARLGCFGLDERQIRDMLALGAADDDHSLIGMARMVAHMLPAPTAAGGRR
ncbi:ROK family protein [Streptomyces olivaceus]|uniref:ROK family protein n=1 Tax=Streptomyces olivaceus TaxID=47716 RepID=UPI001CD00FB3|nr:ROK family protein [Streptomyces olivaceus]MBZ6141446.1 ROK family protein [Streptomyces olivaceus]MBZ6169210.1 ROK family protein [Streptomyces olivaceus]MBZ6176245.1 ROK family protein [Streptomyces olivaceus]MBZ6182555.1 ROK family protein [Streptomyces olivaceus]